MITKIKNASLNLATFQITFDKFYSLNAKLNSHGILAIGINHINQNTFKFNENTVITPKQAISIWHQDLEKIESIANRWLELDIEQYQYDAICDLLLMPIFGLTEYKPVSLFEAIHNHRFNLAADEFLRWIYEPNLKATISNIKRAFGRRALFLNRDYKRFAIKTYTLIDLNELLAADGYRVVHSKDHNFKLQKIQ